MQYACPDTGTKSVLPPSGECLLGHICSVLEGDEEQTTPFKSVVVPSDRHLFYILVWDDTVMALTHAKSTTIAN